MSFRISTIALSLLAGSVCLAPVARAGGGLPLRGDLLGEVHSSASGAAQMGAGVYLYDRYDQLVRKGLTTETGKFIFTDLAPDVYSIRVVLASFETAFRRNIAVAAGSPIVLKINLSSVLSSVELVPASATPGILMTDEWKWVLRGSQSTRPVLRLLPVSSSSQSRSAKFTETSGVVRLSAGDGDAVAGTTAQEMGTAFALATVLNGANHLRLSGNFGYLANSGLPTAGFRSTFAHDEDGATGPKISVTVHQIYFPSEGGAANLASYQGGDATGPVLRTISAGVIDKLDINDRLKLEYGSHFDTVSFLERINRASPFARATYDLGAAGSLRFAFSNGSPPQELLAQNTAARGADVNAAQSYDLNQDLNALAMLPRVSSEDGNLRLQNTRSLEAGYRYVHGSRKYSAGVYTESVRDAAYTLSSSGNFLNRADLLPDLDSGNYVFDIGNYARMGYDAAVTQSLGDNFDLTLAAGRAGALVASGEAPLDTAADARMLVHQAQRLWATARAAARLPGSGTYIMTSYGWTDFRSLMPVHLSLTGDIQQEEGWNLAIRQPLPGFNRMHGRLEATGELRNAMAQGYLPLNAAGHCAVLTNAPRTLRGGLAFLF